MGCYKCGDEKSRLFNTFGKLKRRKCIDASKTGIKGHSGMIKKQVNENDYYDLTLPDCLYLLKVKKSNPLYTFWYLEHYPKSKGIVGRQLNYIIYKDRKPIGIIGCASPPLNYKLFRKHFKTDNEKLFVNNNVCRIVHTDGDRNMGTKILKLFRNRIKEEYQTVYGDKLLGIVTFVEPPRTGAMYKADNWKFLGMTQGVEVKRRGDDWFQKSYQKGVQKFIYVHNL